MYVTCHAPLTSATLYNYMPYSLAVSLVRDILSSTKDTKEKKLFPPNNP